MWFAPRDIKNQRPVRRPPAGHEKDQAPVGKVTDRVPRPTRIERAEPRSLDDDVCVHLAPSIVTAPRRAAGFNS